MIGRKLTARLVRDGALNGKALTRLTLVDIVAPARPEFGGAVETVAADLISSKKSKFLGEGSSRFCDGVRQRRGCQVPCAALCSKIRRF
jgi:hypothetical protein